MPEIPKFVTNPLFRMAAGAFAGGVLFNRGGKSGYDRSDGSDESLWTHTAAGAAIGAGLGLGFPWIKNKVIQDFKNLKPVYERNFEGVFAKATEAHAKELAEIQAKTMDPAKKAEKLASFAKRAPRKEDELLKLRAAAETYLNPKVLVPAGMALGAMASYSRGNDPFRGAFLGGMAGYGAGFGYHAVMRYLDASKPVRAVVGASMIAPAYLLGARGNPDEIAEEAVAAPAAGGNYYPQTVGGYGGGYSSGAGRRAESMGATGDIVFGLQNLRHGGQF